MAVISESQLATVELDKLPEGWKPRNRRSLLKVGDVTGLLLKTFGGSWRFNQLTMRIELNGVPLPPQEVDLLYVQLSLKGWAVAKNSAIDGARAAAFLQSFHPVQEYLDRIAADESIEPADLSTIASTYLDTKDDLYDAMLRATLIGAVTRTFNPGCMFKTALVLKGGQDIGKSSVVRNLASPDWVCDTSQDNDKDFLQAIHSGWIYELAELDSIVSKKEAGKLKNWISSPKDNFRPPYGRTMEPHERRSIFIGTSNRDDFLRDETGASRWWVVELPHNANKGFRINHDRVRQDRDAIWKAAVLAHRAGELPLLTDAQQAESNRRNLGFEVDHPWEDFIVEWLEKPGAPAVFTTEQCFHLSGCYGSDPVNVPDWVDYFPPVAQKDAVEIGKILRRLGYVRDKHQKRENGKKLKRMWRRAGDDVGHDINPPEPKRTEVLTKGSGRHWSPDSTSAASSASTKKKPKKPKMSNEELDQMIAEWRAEDAEKARRAKSASAASTPASLPEAGQTPTGGSEVSDPPHVSSSFIEKEQGQEEEQMAAVALLGKTPEAPEALSVGSGFDGDPDNAYWGMWD